VTIFLNGNPIVVDPGTACYTSDPGKRNAFRSTRSHATIAVGDEEQNRFVTGNLFSLPQEVKTDTARLDITEGGPQIDACMRGYGPWSEDEIRIVRRVRYSPERRLFSIEDEVIIADSLGSLPISWHFPLAPGLTPETVGPGQCRLKSPDGDVVAELLFFPGWILEQVPSMFSPSYGEEVRNVTLRFTPPSGSFRSHFIFRAAASRP
jgi:hypothetical protein